MFITDADAVSVADLEAVDPEVLTLANQVKNGTPLVGPESIIRQANDHACHEITAKFQGYSGYLVSGPGGFANHLAAITNNYSTTISRPRMRLNQIVSVEPDPSKRLVKNWIKYLSLQFFYRSVYHRFMGSGNKGTNDDRLAYKMYAYEEEAKNSWNRLEWAGLPLVLVPLCAPGAVREYQAGVWSASNVTAGGSGSLETGNQYDVVITWTGLTYQSYKQPMNSESAPSAIQSVQTAAGQYLTVSIATLNPPNGIMPNVGVSDGAYSPMPALGWNIYAGVSGGPLYLQTSSPIPIATTSYTFSEVPGVNSMTVGVGQAPDFNYAFNRVLQRN